MKCSRLSPGSRAKTVLGRVRSRVSRVGEADLADLLDRAGQLDRALPRVRAVRERGRRGGVVGRVRLDLGVEELDGVAQVRAQPGGHLRRRADQAGVDRAPGAQDRIVGVGGVDAHRAGEPVDDRVDRRARVVHAGAAELDRLRVRVAAARRVAAEEEVDVAAGDDGVRVAVPAQERGKGAQALAGVAVQEDPRAAGDGLRQQEVEVAEAQREGRAPREARQPDAARAVVVVVGRLGAGRGLVDLGAAAGDDDVRRAGGGLLAEIDAWLAQAERVRVGPEAGLREPRVAGFAHLGGADGRHPVAVGVGEARVGPAARIAAERAQVEPARRDGQRPGDAADGVAVERRAREAVIAPERLELVERRAQDVRVPERDVVDRLAVLLEVGGRHRLVSRGGAGGDAIEREGPARGGDRGGDVRPFLGELLGLDHVALERARDQPGGSGGQDRERERDGGGEQLQPTGGGAGDDAGGDHREPRQGRARRGSHVRVREPGSRQPAVRQRQRVAVEPVAPAHHQQDERGEQEQMRASAARDDEAAVAPDAAGDGVHGDRRHRGHRQRGQQPRDDVLVERQ